MSAHSMIGIKHDVADKMDAFWARLSPEHRAALHVAYNLKKCSWPKSKEAFWILTNAESGRNSICNVTNTFFNFMAAHVETCSDAESMMKAILDER